jgi:Methyltransferase domain
MDPKMLRNAKTRLRVVIDKLPYIRGLRKCVDDCGAFAPGHFYSPIPNQEEVDRVVARMRTTSAVAGDVPSISMNRERQLDLLKVFERFYPELPFPEEPTAGCRFFYRGSPYPYPDAIFLYSFLRFAKPRQIIEVGSGFSSAVMLDTVDRFFPQPPKMTFIEPYPVNLNRLLRPEDRERVTIVTDKVQNTPIELFASLNDGDLLFIDSSHVVKCGSDLSFLFFEVLPRLSVGVYVHFHDIFQSFEYPEEWLRGGWYWNEAYFLKAFLSNNNAWEICFFNNYVRTAHADFLADRMPLCLKDVGGSLYIRRVAKN